MLPQLVVENPSIDNNHCCSFLSCQKWSYYLDYVPALTFTGNTLKVMKIELVLEIVIKIKGLSK